MRITKQCVAIGGLMLVTLCMNCAPQKNCPKGEPVLLISSDSVVRSHLNQQLADILFLPDSVLCYHLTYRDSISKDDVQPIQGYVRDSLIACLDSSQAAMLQSLLPAVPRNYSDDTTKVQSPYFPILEFEFNKRGKTPVGIVVSLSDHTWQVAKNGKAVLSYNYIGKDSVERFCKQFIDIYYNPKKDDKK